jgi:hypothetical protein
MDESTEWTPTEKVLYVVLVPLVALVGFLMLVSVATKNHHASAATPAGLDMSVSAVKERARQEAIDERRDTYYDCLETMGVKVRGFASRFSRRPSRETLRTAGGVCSALMQLDTGRAPPAPHTPGPNTL